MGVFDIDLDFSKFVWVLGHLFQISNSYVKFKVAKNPNVLIALNWGC